MNIRDSVKEFMEDTRRLSEDEYDAKYRLTKQEAAWIAEKGLYDYFKKCLNKMVRIIMKMEPDLKEKELIKTMCIKPIYQSLKQLSNEKIKEYGKA
jgi:hypothetical protein